MVECSVIIPVYNDPKGIQTTLESTLPQKYDSYEVIPVDNDSTDETNDVIKKASDACSNRIYSVEETDTQSSYAARNTGIKHASGNIYLFLDANMWVPETWIGEMVTAFESRDCDYLGCNVKVVAEDHNFWEAYEQSFSFPIKSYLEHKHFAPTCALAVRHEVFEEVGLFDERLESGGDKEFGQRVYRAGFKQCYAGDVTAYHPARDSWDALRSKALRIGRGRAQKREYYPNTSHHPVHPSNFLPPSPFRLRRRFSGQGTSIPSLVGFYLLEYILKLTQSYGAIRETLSQRRSDKETSR
ncbi:glycosyltransferase [Haloterrigena alkaliphila]|uniref:Glycosyltransferase n=1 Tax=Haloterrigena alkaliphila TaxID=2816475 RepID=A0A8A2VEG0_9EURY|nr:glycosyltransferase [Haloterrigena alkaliphila]QSW99646.1 glycosyltransferase [Haloterrigena alkaliphila]